MNLDGAGPKRIRTFLPVHKLEHGAGPGILMACVRQLEYQILMSIDRVMYALNSFVYGIFIDSHSGLHIPM